MLHLTKITIYETLLFNDPDRFIRNYSQSQSIKDIGQSTDADISGSCKCFLEIEACNAASQSNRCDATYEHDQPTGALLRVVRILNSDGTAGSSWSKRWST